MNSHLNSYKMLLYIIKTINAINIINLIEKIRIKSKCFNFYDLLKDKVTNSIDYLYNIINDHTTFKIKLIHENAKIPKKTEPGSAGYDVFSVENITINSKCRSLVHIGISTEFSKNHYLRCAPRSGLSVKGIDVGAGVIDSSYRGSIKVLIINNGSEPFEINVGDKIAQLILEKISNPEIIVSEYLSNTDRNEAGFGSSGK